MIKYVVYGAVITLLVGLPALAQQATVGQNIENKLNELAAEVVMDWPSALTHSKLLCHDNPQSKDALAMRGLAYMRSGDIEAARIYLTKAKALNTERSYWESVLQCRLLQWDNHVLDALSILTVGPQHYPVPFISRQAFYAAYFADTPVAHAFIESHSNIAVLKEIIAPYDLQVTSEEYSLPNTCTSTEGAECIIPFTYSKNAMWISIKINGKTMELRFDTGANELILTKSSAQRVELKSLGIGETGGITGRENIKIMSGDEVVIGLIKAKSVPIRVLNRDSQILGDGIFGANLLKQFDVIIDNDEKVIKIFPHRSSKDNHDTYAVPLHFQRGIPFVCGSVAGKNRLGIVDSGSWAVTLSYPLAKELTGDGLDGDGKETIHKYLESQAVLGTTSSEHQYLSSKQSVQFQLFTNKEPYKFACPLMGASSLDAPSKGAGLEVGFDLGIPFFMMQRTVEIDYPNNMLYITGR